MGELAYLDERVTAAMFAFARETDDWDPSSVFPVDLDARPSSAMLFVPWSLYEYVPEQGRIADRFSASERLQQAWIDAQKQTSLRVWHVLEVDFDRALVMRCSITNAERVVQDRRAARTLSPGSALLARIVEFEGTSFGAGMHPITMPSREVTYVPPGPEAVEAWEALLRQRAKRPPLRPLARGRR